MKRKASAVWRGDLKSGRGTISTESTVLKDAQYSFGTRFENGPGTNPEELIGAAHAGCYAMALSGNLDAAKLKAEAIDVTATVTLDTSGAPTVTKIHLDVTARIPGADDATFQELAKKTKETCPISRLLSAAAEISMTAKLG
jgi:osmotically inducible protein OsmC